MKYLDELDSSYAVLIISRESDSLFISDIIELANLSSNKLDFLFDDVLYKRSILNGNVSSIQYYNDEYAVHSRRMSLKSELNSNLISYLNGLRSDTSVFNFNQRFEMLASENLVNNGTLSYSYSMKMPFILKLNFVNQIVDTFVRIDRHLAEKAYLKFFGDNEKTKVQLDVLSNNKVKLASVQNVFLTNNGNVAVSIHYTYFDIRNNGDTIGKKFTAVHEFDEAGYLLSTGVVDLRKLHLATDSSCYVRASNFILESDTLIISFVNPKYGKGTHTFDQFLAIFTLDNRQNYQFWKFVDRKIPSVYDHYGYYFSQTVFSNNWKYFGPLLSDSIFDMNSHQSICLEIF